MEFVGIELTSIEGNGKCLMDGAEDQDCFEDTDIRQSLLNEENMDDPEDATPLKKIGRNIDEMNGRSGTDKRPHVEYDGAEDL